MIAIPKPLSKDECKAIKEMLLSEPFKNLCRVASGTIDWETIEAINDRQVASPDNNRAVSAEKHDQTAHKYAAFLAVVKEFRSAAVKDGVFSVVELKPTNVLE